MTMVTTYHIDEEIIHLPDYRFAKWCEGYFSINRGIYNTIDEKLFESGYKIIEQRRKAVITFLRQNVPQQTNTKFYKFGHGNLTEALYQFLN